MESHITAYDPGPPPRLSASPPFSAELTEVLPHSERNAKDLGLKQAPLVLRWSFEHLLQASWHAPGSPAGPGLGSSFCLPVPPTSCLSNCLKENANLLCSAQACPSKCNSQTGTSSWWVVSDPGCQSPGSQWDCGPTPSLPSASERRSLCLGSCSGQGVGKDRAVAPCLCLCEAMNASSSSPTSSPVA